MNFKLVLRITGFTLLIEAGAMLIPLAVSLLYGESPVPFLCTILIILAAACVPVFLLKPRQQDFFAREKGPCRCSPLLSKRTPPETPLPSASGYRLFWNVPDVKRSDFMTLDTRYVLPRWNTVWT